MDHTSRMTTLLGRMRRERNGAEADAMRCWGHPCGLNYGVSLPTVRQIAREQGCDHELARFLWRQDVRELRLAALHIADPARLSPAERDFWGAGIVNSELAEEAAFALLSRTETLPELFPEWIGAENPLLRYTALLAAARSPHLGTQWLEPALAAVRMQADPVAVPWIVRGAVAMLAALGTQNEENRQAVLRATGSRGKLPAEDRVHEELAWLLAGPQC